MLVVLVGPPGAGKTTVGKRLANALHTNFVDTDALIEQSTGQSCGAVFSKIGEPEFRKLEESKVREALGTSGVVSLGGRSSFKSSHSESIARTYCDMDRRGSGGGSAENRSR